MKARSRYPGQGSSSLNLEWSHFENLREVCGHFAVDPWLAFVVDADNELTSFLMPIEVAESLNPGGRKYYFRMTDKARQKYAKHPDVEIFSYRLAD